VPVALPLIEISVLAVLWLCIALALLIVGIMGKVGELVRPIWLVGGTIADGIESVAQSIAGALGGVESGIDSAIGASWHELARLVDELWHVIEESAGGYAALAEYVAKLVYAHSGLRSLVHSIEATVHGIEHGVRDLERVYRGIEAKVRRIENDVVNGIGHDLRLGLQKVEKTVNAIANGTIPALSRGIDGVDNSLTQLQNFIKAIPGVSYLDWAAGIVAAAVGLDVLNGLRCPQFGRLMRKWGCGLGSILDGLLGLVVSGLILTNICDVLGLLESAYGDVAGPLISFLTEIPLGGCEVPPASWAVLAVPAGPLPPAQTLGALPV